MPTSTVDTSAHGNLHQEDDEDCDVDSNLDLSNHDSSVSPSANSQKWHEAVFVLSIKETHALSQAAVDDVLSNTTIFVSETLSKLVENVRDEIPADVAQLLEMKVNETSNDLFKGLTTSFLQKKYFHDHFDLIVG